MNPETKKEVFKYVLLGVGLIIAAIYVIFLVFFASPEFPGFPGR